MRTKIHFHTDCPFFAGCENMLSVLFNNQQFNEKFEFSFSYSFSKEYEEGMNRRIKTELTKYPLSLSKPSSTHASGVKQLVLKILQPIYFLIDVYKIYKVISTENPDLIHINNGGYPGALSCSAAVFSAKLAGKNKIIYVVNNIAFPVNSFQRLLLYPIDWFVGKNVTTFITASTRAKNALRQVLGITADKVFQIPNTIVPRSVMEKNEEFRKRYGIGRGDILIGCVALFVERKGHKYLIDALAQLLREYTGKNRIYLILDGEGEKKGDIVDLISKLKLEKSIIMTKSQNIYDVYNSMDFLVLPSIEKEDFPNVVIESMYMGKAVVGTDVGGISEQIIDGYNGFIIKPRDSNELSKAMLKLANDKKYSKKLGENGKKVFEEKFSENAIVERYIKLYQNILGQNK